MPTLERENIQQESVISQSTGCSYGGQSYAEAAGGQNSKPSDHKDKKWFNFFTRWFFLGAILILVSLILSGLDVSELPSYAEEAAAVKYIISGLLSSIGIALLVGSVFDFSKNSEAFLQLITAVLSEIVVSKTFLETLSQEDKEQALRLILKPSNRQLEQYSNINAFFNKRIKESMTMFNINFKTNMVLDIRIYRNEEDGKLYAHTIATQTSYRIQERFEPIKLMFDKPNSKALDVYILPPFGEVRKLERSMTTEKIGGFEYSAYTCDIPEDCQKYDHLTIKQEWIEPGFDHWINYSWQSLTPYEGLICFLSCESGLTIKDSFLFDNRAYYHVALSDDKRKLEITSSQWLEADTGFVVTVSEAEDTSGLDSEANSAES